MKINEDHISLAIKTASRSPFKKYLNGSALIYDDKTISLGWSHKSNVRMNATSTIHAEIHSLGRARHLNLTDAVCYTAAISRKSGNVCLAQPCLSCAIALYSANIRWCVYTIDKANYGVLDLAKDLSDLKVYELHRED